MKIVLFSSICLLLTLTMHAQNHLELSEKLYREKENKLAYAIQLRDYYLDNNSDSLLKMGSYLVRNGIENQIDSYINYGKLTLAGFYNTKGKVEISIPYLESCIKYYQKRKDYGKLADAENQMGIAYIYDSDLNKAADYFIRSMKSAEQLGDKNDFYMAELNLCEVYIRQEKLDLAEAEVNVYLNRSIKKNYANAIRKSYDYLTKIHLQKGDIALASEYANKALEIALRKDSKKGKANAYNNLAIVNFEVGDEQLALENFKKALQIRLELKSPIGINESYYNLGDWNYYTGNLKEAIVNYKISLDIALKNNLKKEQADAYARLSETYKEMGNISEAFDMQSKYISTLKENQKINAKNSFSYQQIAYEIELQEAQALQKQREDKLNSRMQAEQDRGKIIVIGFSLIIGFFIIWQFFILAKNKRKNKLIIHDVQQEISEKMKNRDARWNRIEHFISKKHSEKFHFENIYFLEQYELLKLNETFFLFFETGSSSLENYLFIDYIKNELTENPTESELETLIQNQNLLDSRTLSFGFLKEIDGQWQLKGNGFILLKDPDTLSLSTSNYQAIQGYKLILSDRLKNHLIQTVKWDQLMKNLSLIENMSTHMALEAFRENWQKELTEENFGMIYLV